LKVNYNRVALLNGVAADALRAAGGMISREGLLRNLREMGVGKGTGGRGPGPVRRWRGYFSPMQLA